MAPGYNDGLVYVSTVPLTATAAYPGGGVGTLWALDAKTGKKKWHFDTVPKGLWGDKKVNSGGGLWQPPSFDDKGFIYFGTGNPAPYPGTPQEPWGSSRPGPNLYTNSMVKLDATTGKMRVVLPADAARRLRLGLPGSAAADRRRRQGTGGRRRQVGRASSPSTPIAASRSGNARSAPTTATTTTTSTRCKANTRRSRPGELFPGVLGGVIAPMATDGKTIFVPVVNLSASVTASGQLGEGGAPSGELVAIDAASGQIVWNQEFSSAAVRGADGDQRRRLRDQLRRRRPRLRHRPTAANSGSEPCRPASTPASRSTATPSSPPPVWQAPKARYPKSSPSGWAAEEAQSGPGAVAGHAVPCGVPWRAKRSAGILLYRLGGGAAAAAAGPSRRARTGQRRDLGAWTIPKGEYEEGESPRDCALRELGEELGAAPETRPRGA